MVLRCSSLKVQKESDDERHGGDIERNERRSENEKEKKSDS